MSKELTEKLKQGNLKDGYYYAKMPTGCVDVVSLYNLRQLRLVKDGDKIEVLDEVPDFCQYRNICGCLFEEHRGNYNLLEENDKLKELLLKAKEEIQNDMDYTEFNEVGKLKLVKQINQAIRNVAKP